MNSRLSTHSYLGLKAKSIGRALWGILTVGLSVILMGTLMSTTAAAEHLPPFGFSQAWQASAARYSGMASAESLSALSSNRAWAASTARYTGLAALQGASMDSFAEWAGFYATEITSRSSGRAADLNALDGMEAFYGAAVKSRISFAALSIVDGNRDQTYCARSRDGSVDSFTLGYPTAS